MKSLGLPTETDIAGATLDPVTLSPQESEVITLLLTARTDGNVSKARSHLEQALALCGSALLASCKIASSLRLEVLSELAKHSELATRRQKLWKQGIDGAYAAVGTHDDIRFMVQLLREVIDYTQDPYVCLSEREINTELAKARKLADISTRDRPNEEIAQLLSCKASLLRHMSKTQTTRIQEIEVCSKAIRCAQKAVKLSEGVWYSLLDLAECVWHSAQFEANEVRFNKTLSEAEGLFQQSVDKELNRINILALARFYRCTYQAMPFVSAYQQYERIEHNKSEYLRGSFMWAEGVLQLWYAKYPDELVVPLLQKSDSVLERAIDSGYGDARHIVALAFLKAAQGDTTTGTEVVKMLHPVNSEIAWVALADRIKNLVAEDKTLDAGLALGITQSGIWNKLGTYARRFLGDDELAEALYRTALQLSRSNAVVLTNLAFTLAKRGTPAQSQEAERLISKAASCADRRFRWWRTVREYIVHAKAQSQPPEQDFTLKENPRLYKLSDLRKVYECLFSSSNKQQRGYALERIVARLIQLSLGNVRPSYRISRTWADGSISQIDAAFCLLETQYFRVETKWMDEPVPPSAIVEFRDKLDVVGIVGLFISVNGFTREAVAKAAAFRNEREIILMDGDDLRLTLIGSPSFDEAIRQKRQHLLILSNPYHKLEPTDQDEVE